ncbi:MAG: hypothetical protein JRH14_08275, partial [Deltaproteobacteria bacterium]|nr:hypothetical protein [Deltaproteobacteria bacterium]
HGTSEREVFAMGRDGTVLDFNGTSWAQADLEPGVALHGAFDLGEDDVWMLGDRGSIFRRVDGDWATLFQGRDEFYADIMGTSPSNIYTAGSDGDFGIVRHFDSFEWAFENTEIPLSVGAESVWAANDSDVWAVAPAGFVSHFDGNRWSASRPVASSSPGMAPTGSR